MSAEADKDKVQGAPMFASAEKIYPREMKGRFDRLSKLATITLLGLFYVVPWLMWDDRQAFLFDLPARKFYLLGLTLWPQDFPYLAMLLVIAALTLFFFTALLGRVWCGFACPQTVWTEAFIWMEQWAEGTRKQRMKLDKAPWSWNKLRRKGSKQLLWLSFSLWTGFTFVAYFTPAQELGPQLLTFSAGSWATFWTVFYAFATYGNAGYMREQVCKYMCPYARFQSAMFDNDTLIISYDETRGEPRGGRNRSADPQALGLGDCIDCTLCVQVCPTGIDIREGLQMECIHCTQCIDACDQVMDRIGLEPGLISYTSQAELESGRRSFLRPRLVVYSAILLVMFGAFTFSLAGKKTADVTLLRGLGAPFTILPSGEVSNQIRIKIANRSPEKRSYLIVLSNGEGLTMIAPENPLTVAPGQTEMTGAFITAPISAFSGGETSITLTIGDGVDFSKVLEYRILGPAGGWS